MSLPLPFLTADQLLEVYTLTKTATAIHVTEDAIIQTANDAMLRVWDKDRSVIGKSLEDALPELKGQPFIDMFKRVWNEGLTISGTDTPADLNINGTIQTVYFDFEYRAIKDNLGQTYCILHTATDVTDRFLGREAMRYALEKEGALERERALNEELAAANEELSAMNEEYQEVQANLHLLNIELEERVKRRTNDLAESLKKLVHSEQRLDNILHQLPSPVVVLGGPDQVIEVTNEALLSFWNKTKEEVIGRPMLDVFPELKSQPFPNQWKHVLATGETIINKEKPVVFNKESGPRLYYVDYYYQPLTDFDGTRTAVLATVLDVTHKVEARKQLEENQVSLQKLNDELAAINEEMTASNEELTVTNEELAESQVNLVNTNKELAASESRFRLLVEQAPVAINIFKTRELIIDVVNDKMLEIWGKTSDIKGMPLAKALPELEGQPFLQILDDVITTGETYYGNESKARIITNGKESEKYFNLIYKPIRNQNGVTDRILQVASDVTEQVTIKLELEKAQEMMRLAIEAAKLGSWYIDPVTKALKYNHMLAKLFGYEGAEKMTYEQAIGQVTEEYRDKIVEEIENAIVNGGDYDITYSQKRFDDGEIIWLRSLGKINQDGAGGLRIFSGFVMDITELKKDEQRKNDFIGMVSHELKTPLTSLNGYIQLLQTKAEGKGDKFTSGALATAGKQVKKMTTMINGFLNISRLESGKIVLNKSTIRLDELVKAVIEETMVMTTSHIISFNCNTPTTLSGDYDKISNVVSNLLSNAIKYAPNNPEVEVKCQLIDGMAQISVRDQGPGIASEQLPQLFERYYRAETNHTISGFGIGLYLSSEIIERHNGKIWATSEIGKGSTFYFQLPLA